MDAFIVVYDASANRDDDVIHHNCGINHPQVIIVGNKCDLMTYICNKTTSRILCSVKTGQNITKILSKNMMSLETNVVTFCNSFFNSY